MKSIYRALLQVTVGVCLILSFTQCDLLGGSNSSSSTSQPSGSSGATQSLEHCQGQSQGTICGTLLAPNGSTPIANARIYAKSSTGSTQLVTLAKYTTDDDGDSENDDADDSSEDNDSDDESDDDAEEDCRSDAQGNFICECPHYGEDIEFVYDSSLIDGEFTADCLEEGESTVDDDTVIDRGETMLAVVTGRYDKVEVILSDIFACGELNGSYFEYGSECDMMHIYDGYDMFDSDDADPNNSDSNYRSGQDLLSNLQLMQTYDMIFINCGADDHFASDTTIIQNLQTYIAAGGKVYASDWAYNFIEQSFPSKIEFYGSVEDGDGDPLDGLSATPENEDSALVGDINYSTDVTVTDNTLLDYLRTEGLVDDNETDANVIFNLNAWAVMLEVDDTVNTLLSSDEIDVSAYETDALPNEQPVAVLHCDEAALGGFFYGSYHTELGITSYDDVQEEILRFLILNGFNTCI